MSKRRNTKIAILILTIVACICLMSACRTNQVTPICTINVSEYLSINFDGYHEYGDATIGIDYEKMLTDIFVLSNVNDEIKGNYKTIVKSGKAMTATATKSEMLSNGDVIDVTITPNDDIIAQLNQLICVDFVFEPVNFTVFGLKDTEEIDVLECAYIETDNSFSGTGTIKISTSFMVDSEEMIEWNLAHDAQDGSISNGDIITIKIPDSIDVIAFTKSTGYKIPRTEIEHQVKELYEPINGKEIMNRLNTAPYMDIVVQDWVVSCLNDERTYHTPRTFSHCGSALYCNDETSECMIIGLYSIQDPLIVEPYFVFVGLKGEFSANCYTLAMRDGSDVPDSFVYYEKEMVRYNADAGWGQGQEKMGFIYNSRGYAGHQHLSETFAYLEEMYGVNYSRLYVSESVKDDAPERAEVVEYVR